MLLCHGWEGYAYNFALLIDQAVQAGYEVHAFDHLAHGDSEGTLGGLPVALSTLLTAAEHVQRTAGPMSVLIGHSLGGAAAAWAAAHRQIELRRLVLIAPFYDTAKLSRLWAKAHFLPEDIRAALQSGLQASSGKTFDDFMPASLAKHLNGLPELHTLLLHDTADKVTAYKHSAALAASAKQAQLHTATELGHIAILADDACMRRVMEFVQAV